MPGGRSWQQILSDARDKRNILELHLSKIPQKDSNNQPFQPKHLTHDDLSDFLFKDLKIKHADLLSIDYTTSSYGHREVELLPGVDITPYLTGNNPREFRFHKIHVKPQKKNTSTKILFRNVPLNVPDEELINLCMCYGEPVGWVSREKLTNFKDKGLPGSNRSVEVNLNKGASFENYFWLEGPLPGDQGRRVVVTHQGQPQQCSHCFGYDSQKYGKQVSDLCPAKGNGKACRLLETPRAKMGAYMKELERLVGYTSLKVKYSKKLSVEDIIEDAQNEEEESEATPRVVFKTPVAERDELIQTLQDQKSELEAEVPQLKEQLTKVSKLLEIERNMQKQKYNKDIQMKKIIDKQVSESIKSDYSLLSKNRQLISLLALFQDRDNFIIDEENQTVKPVQEQDFVEEITREIEGFIQETERLADVKNQLLEGLKIRWLKKSRRWSNASQLSLGSKRDREEENIERSNKLRVQSPTPAQLCTPGVSSLF